METVSLLDVADFYDSQKKVYDNIHGVPLWDIVYSQYNDFLHQYLPNSCNAIAELGCGTGLNSSYLLKKANRVYGVDFTNSFLRSASEKYYSYNNFIPIQSDITSIPLKDDSVDGIVCFNTLDHVCNIDRFFSEVHRIAKNDSILLFDLSSNLFFNMLDYFRYFEAKNIFSPIRNFYSNRSITSYEIIGDDSNYHKIQIYKTNPNYLEKTLSSVGFEIIEKIGMPISSSAVIPEKILSSSRSKLLCNFNTLLHPLDKKLNEFNFFKNRALQIFYACKIIKD